MHNTAQTEQEKTAVSETSGPIPSEKIVIGLTGSMGSGKSTVRRILSEIMPVTDADAINAFLLEKGQEGWKQLKESGLLYQMADGQCDKAAMARRMFTDPEYRRKAESILHPLILKQMHQWTHDQKGSCLVEVPLLFELGLEGEFDQVWTVICSEETALQRLQQQRHIPPEEARRRLACQYPAEKKAAASDCVFTNDSTLEALEDQVLSAWNHLQENKSSQKEPLLKKEEK